MACAASLQEDIQGHQNSELLKAVVKSITEDEGFMLPTPQAASALSTASKLLLWVNDSANKEELGAFSNRLFECLENCLPLTISKCFKTEREKMWKKFHSLRVSDSFVKLWHDFLESASLDKNPLLFQYVSDHVMQKLITKKFTVEDSSPSTTSPVPKLTYEEVNALRYVAGYVCMKVKKKIESSNHTHKNVFLLCLMDLCDEEEDTSESADWVHAVNRGGLCLVSETTAMLFHEIELLVRKALNNL